MRGLFMIEAVMKTLHCIRDLSAIKDLMNV